MTKKNQLRIIMPFKKSKKRTHAVKCSQIERKSKKKSKNKFMKKSKLRKYTENLLTSVPCRNDFEN